jgi:(1->4)-alpha-D-glucan 1-alpha-D-glucosylmutase
MAERVATYRWQLEPGRGFAEAADAVADLAALGVSHLYLSPLAEAVPGSTHGYDVTDPTRPRDELGGAEGFAELTAACRSVGLHLLVDIVPNHLAAHETNAWWWDLLRMGPASAYAEVFDVDWSSSDPLLLPVLGDHYGRELEAGRIRLEEGRDPGRLIVIRYADRTFPVRPESEGAILAEVARRLDDDVLGVAARLLAAAERSTVDASARAADLAVAERTARVRLDQPGGTAALAAELDAISADPDRLDLVLARQHHRLARWAIGDAELGYRRFFDVDALAATRMDGPAAFDLVHRLALELVADPAVDGLRVDHVDGLVDPAAYLSTLRQLAGPDAWLLVEKILRADEALPAWPVAGTTGYEVAELLGGWLTDPAGAAALQAGWAERVGDEQSYREVALDARREVLTAGFATDLSRVVDALQEVCRHRRRHRDHARAALHAAVFQLALHTPTYRTYVVPAGVGGGEVGITDADRAVISAAVAGAKAAAPELDPELLDLVASVLTGTLSGEAEATVVARFQ